MIISKEVILPSPVAVIIRLTELLCEKEFFISVAMSLLRVIAGYAVGVVVGALLAVISFYSGFASIILSPLFTMVRATPVASFIIIALVWIGRETVPSFTAFLMVLPIIYSTTLTGLRSADKSLLEMATVFKFSKIKKLKLLYIPSAIPSFLGGAKTSLGLAWKSCVAAEVLSSPKFSIGGEIYDSKLYLETTDLMAWTVCVIILSLIFETIISISTSSVYKKYTIREVADDEADN